MCILKIITMEQALKKNTNKKNNTETEVLLSLEKAISLLESTDFLSITKTRLARTKSPKRKKIIENLIKESITNPDIDLTNSNSFPIFSDEKEDEPAFQSEKPLKSKIIKKNNLKTKPTRKSKSGRRALFKKINFILPLRESIKGYSENYKKQFINLTLGLVMVAFTGFSTYIAYAYVSSNSGDLVEKVGAHVVLPVGETPKVYIIQSDKSEIFQNPLFTGIEVGDNVLSYTKSGKVIIYRNKVDKVVNIVNTTQ